MQYATISKMQYATISKMQYATINKMQICYSDAFNNICVEVETFSNVSAVNAQSIR